MKVWLRIAALGMIGTWLAGTALADEPVAKKVLAAKNDAPRASEASQKETKNKNRGATPRRGMAATAPNSEGRELGRWKPMPGLNGTPGLFTIQTGDTLPRWGFAVTGFVDKFGRAPGSLTMVNTGWAVGVGLTNWLTAFVGWDPHRHIHLGDPGQLSTNSPLPNPQFDNTAFRVWNPALSSRPSYVEDYPFAFTNNGGIGEVHLGVKASLLSELRGNPVSFALSDESVIPTKSFPDLLADGGVQSGAYANRIGATVSKTFGNVLQGVFDFGYVITRDPRKGSQILVVRADQVQLGAGLLFFPNNRFQIINEYDGTVYVGDATPTITFGARDPVAGIWGFRVYLIPQLALDAGYRYMLNLGQIRDRHGFVIKLSTGYWPTKPAPPDEVTAQCSADRTSVQEGSGERVRLSVQASDSLGHPLNYSWTATGGEIRGSGASVEWDSTGVAPGSYTVTVRVDDGLGHSASCSETITVTPKPIPPPTMSCAASRSTVLPGERVGISATVHDESGTPLTYTWRTTGGLIVGTGSSIELDTTNLAPGTYTVTGRVENQKGGAADCSVDITVQAPPPPKPQAEKINECSFRLHSPRVDNVCKRVLDSVALRLQSEAGARVVLVGYATPGRTARAQARQQRLAAQRAENAKKYLVSKGIAADRIETRTGTGVAGAGKQNRRIEIIWVPQGATY